MSTIFELHPQLAKDTYELGNFPLCKLLLHKDANYPWFILVPRLADIQEIYQLASKQQQFWYESELLSRFLMNHFNGDKLNVAALGNMVPQLHIHHIVRFRDDPAWPNPIWGYTDANSYTSVTIEKYRQALVGANIPSLSLSSAGHSV